LALVVVPLMRMKALQRPPLQWPAKGTSSRAVFVAMAPTVLGMSLGQISTLIDQTMAYSLLGEGANTYLYLGNRLLLFPHALTALAVVVAVFPKLASDATEVDRATMRTTLDRAAAAMLFVTVPAAMGLFVLADDVVAGLFMRGNFTEEDAAATALTTRYLLIGLPFLGLSQLYARGYYALALTKTPARIAAWLLAANVALNALLIGVFSMGTEGLAASTSFCAIANAAWLAVGLRRHVPRAPVRRGLWLRNVLATAAMCAAILLVRPEQADSRTAILLWRVAMPITVGIAVYFLAHVAMRSEEIETLRRRKQRPS
jgi:putative peptidoglycan lipid II flippase